MDLVFEAGAEATRRGWADPLVLDATAALRIEPQRRPVICIAKKHEVTTDLARALAALSADSRPLMLVTDAPPSPEVLIWLPGGLVHVPTETPTATDSDPCGIRSADLQVRLEGTLRAMASSPDEFTRESAAEDPLLPADAVPGLVNDRSSRVRGALASNPSVGAEVIRKLGKGQQIRAGEARNPTTPVERLRVLVTDPAQSVLEAVAANPNTPVDVLRAMMGPDGPRYKAVLWGLAANPAAPSDVVRRLLESVHSDIRWLTAERLSNPEELTRLASDTDGSVRWYVAANPNTPVDVVLRMAADPESRGGAASNPKAPKHLLESLAEDDEGLVRSMVAENPNAPGHVLRSLAADPDGSVRAALAKNPTTPPEVLTAIATSAGDGFGRARVARNPSLPRETLRAMCEDPDLSLRLAALHNLLGQVGGPGDVGDS